MTTDLRRTERRNRRRAFARLGLIGALALLAGLTVLTAALLYHEFTRPAPSAAITSPVADQSMTAPSSASPSPVAPSSASPVTKIDVNPPWLRPAPEQLLTRIGVGSCLHQNQPMPIWSAIRAAQPDLFLMIGDNVYGDITNDDTDALSAAYARQSTNPELTAARSAIPFLAIWDDHDYGLNDGGADWKHQKTAAELFRRFWQLPEADAADGGIYYAKTIGPVGQRVQIIMLDTRSFRSPFRRKDSDFPYWGKYQPDPDPTLTMLGDLQWAWFANRLAEPADIRLIVSSVQVMANGHGFERWGNLPAELDRLQALIKASNARGIILLSGDRHSGAIYRTPLGGTDSSRDLVELTASSLNRSFGPSRDADVPPLVSKIRHEEHFGLIEIDWAKRSVALTLRGVGGGNLATLTVAFDELGIERK